MQRPIMGTRALYRVIWKHMTLSCACVCFFFHKARSQPACSSSNKKKHMEATQTDALANYNFTPRLFTKPVGDPLKVLKRPWQVYSTTQQNPLFRDWVLGARAVYFRPIHSLCVAWLRGGSLQAASRESDCVGIGQIDRVCVKILF